MDETAIGADRAMLAERWRREGYWGSATIPDAVAAGAILFPRVWRASHSTEHESRTLTLPEMTRLADEVAARLIDRGICKGDVVAMQMPNWWETAVAGLGIIRAGGVLLPLISFLGAGELGFILRAAGARMLIAPDQSRGVDYVARLTEAGPIASLATVLTVGEDAALGGLCWRDFMAGEVTAPSLPALDADDVCLLLFTSGTTSEPKGVRHTHNSLLHEVRGYRPIDLENRVTFGAGPFGHVASVLDMLRPFFTGNSHVVMDRFEASAAAELVNRYRPSISGGVPFQALSLLERRSDSVDLSSLRYYMLGATAISPAHVEQLERQGITAMRLYGSTEHPTISSGFANDPLDRRARTDGRLMEGVEVRLVDDDGNDVPTGQPGEIASRGPDMFVGYLDPRHDADAFLPGGWFRTGDIGTLDPEGYLTIVDRKKDVIIRGGENLSSKEIEDLLLTMPAVREAAVVAMPDRLYGERVCAFVVGDSAAVTIAAIDAHFRSHGVAKQKMPERLEFIAELPRTAQGKVHKPTLRARLATDGDTASA